MLKLGTYVLAAIAMVPLLLVTADAEAGDARTRRIHKQYNHVSVHKRHDFRLRDINADSRNNRGERLADGRKRFNRSTLAVHFDGDRRYRRHDHHDNHYDNHGHRHYARTRVNTSTVVVINVEKGRSYRVTGGDRPQANTYSGDVDVYSVPGVGTYSYGDASDYGYSADSANDTRASTLKIIDVGDVKPNNGCDMQAGVCIIRP